jgi:hypothetical protein
MLLKKLSILRGMWALQCSSIRLQFATMRHAVLDPTRSNGEVEKKKDLVEDEKKFFHGLAFCELVVN